MLHPPPSTVCHVIPSASSSQVGTTHCRLPLKERVPKNINKRCQKAIKIESKEFCLIGDQLYKRCADQQLSLCSGEGIHSYPKTSTCRHCLAGTFLLKSLPKQSSCLAYGGRHSFMMLPYMSNLVMSVSGSRNQSGMTICH